MAESLFHYAENTDYNTYNIRDFTPLFLDEVLGNMTDTERTEAEKTCGENRECLFDYIVTGQSSSRLCLCTNTILSFSCTSTSVSLLVCHLCHVLVKL